MLTDSSKGISSDAFIGGGRLESGEVELRRGRLYRKPSTCWSLIASSYVGAETRMIGSLGHFGMFQGC